MTATTEQVQKLIFDDYNEGSIHTFELLERLLSTITRADLKHHFLVAPTKFDEKLGLDPEPGVDEAFRKKEMQQFAERLFTITARLLSESFDEKEERKTTRLLIQHGDQSPVVLGELDIKKRPPKTLVNSSLSDYADREMSKKLWEAVSQLLWHANQSPDPKYVMKPFDSWSEFGFRKGDGL